MTVNTVVSELRSLLKEHSRNTHYSDEFLWEVYCDFQSKVIEQQLKKFQHISESMYKTFCLELQLANAAECSDLECKVKRSIYKIPSSISGRNKDTLQVMTDMGKPISRVSIDELNTLQFNDIKKDKIAYSVHNNFIYIWNNLNIKYIKVKALWENVVDFLEIQSHNSCVNVLELDLSTDRSIKSDSIALAFEFILNTKNIQNDQSNDSNSNTR